MIDPKGLRLGNYIKFPHTKKQDGLLEYWNLVIYSIESRFARVSFLDDTRLMSISYNNLFPIPLTEEWLLRLGFKETAKGVFAKDILDFERLLQDDSRWGVHINEEDIGKEIQYVHQLQNLYFALTGEELSLKERP